MEVSLPLPLSAPAGTQRPVPTGRPRVHLQRRERLPRDAVRSLLRAGQAKAAERGHVVTRVVCISMREARERRRRACRGYVAEMIEENLETKVPPLEFPRTRVRRVRERAWRSSDA